MALFGAARQLGSKVGSVYVAGWKHLYFVPELLNLRLALEHKCTGPLCLKI